MDQKLYYVSQDLETIMTRWCEDPARKLISPDPSFFEGLRSDLARAIQHAVRDGVKDESGRKFEIVVRTLELRDLKELRREPGDRREFWIALDDVTVPSWDFHLQVTRIYDCDARKLGVGSRDGDRTILQQIADCQAKYAAYERTTSDPRIVLADDGAYEGGSIIDLAHKLKKHDLPVSTVKLGFATSKGYDAIRAALRPPEFDIHASVGVSNSTDIVWVCERDFYLGVPRGGRTYGLTQKPDDAVPHKLPISFPYVEPFAVARGGGAMDVGKYSFGRSQIEASIRLWSEIERLNNKVFLVSDIPRFPGPGLEKEYAIYKGLPWIEYIRKVASLTFSDI
jgi:hypothetical protein